MCVCVCVCVFRDRERERARARERERDGERAKEARESERAIESPPTHAHTFYLIIIHIPHRSRHLVKGVEIYVYTHPPPTDTHSG